MPIDYKSWKIIYNMGKIKKLRYLWLKKKKKRKLKEIKN